MPAAHLARKDAETFLQRAPQIPDRTDAIQFDLNEVNTALAKFQEGEIAVAAE